ncbi:transposase family protein [Flavobacterium pectinovorum]|uniref:Transposase family protein n=3 Tax=Flavobacterium pectinovorum TaxID=29533 RepID=A0A502F507_9FLAO|nr:transposase family protein [Flavobacterium pectinovorum]TPG44324.1 transposase family protein [Flavobacterium pectinovorum]
MTPIELLKFMLPDFLVEHFEVVSSTNSEEILHLYFEENSKPPEEFNNLQLVSKGFQDEITIQDFPLRGKLVYLHIKRRRWTNKDTGEIVKRDWNLVAKGTRMTQEFAAFLKEINR